MARKISEQMRSLIYGNCAVSNEFVTRELVDKICDQIEEKHERLEKEEAVRAAAHAERCRKHSERIRHKQEAHLVAAHLSYGKSDNEVRDMIRTRREEEKGLSKELVGEPIPLLDECPEEWFDD